MRQNVRKRTVDRMRSGQFRILVVTDVAARGLDIRSISHVINFDLPTVAEDYIHRIGRIGRAGETGTAISFVNHEDRSKLADIERLTGRKLNREIIPGLEPIRKEPKPNPRTSVSKGQGKRASNSNGSKPKHSRPQNRNKRTNEARVY